ncbi:MAG: hypothetical protein AAF368_13000 [Planctomycetota bacterium]
MIALLLSLTVSPQPVLMPKPLPVSTHLVAEDPEAEYDRRRKEVDDDEDGLWDLYEWCEENDLGRQGRACLRRIVKLSPNHKRANEALGYINYDGQWFKNQKKLDAYKKKEELRKAEEEGLVRWKDGWVPQEDLPYLRQGLTKDDSGEWVDAETLEKEAAGWVKQDLVWVSPEEREKMRAGLWKIGEEWKTLEEANEFHSKLDQEWVIPTDHYILHATTTRKSALETGKLIERSFKDLTKIFGQSPSLPVHVFLLNSKDQYGMFAGGSRGQREATETHGLSSVHSAYLGELIFMPSPAGEVDWRPSGVGFWDEKDPNGERWGPFSARHAAGHSFVEGIDSSPRAREKAMSGKGMTEKDLANFYKEKRIPNWFRIAGITYAERYYVDAFVQQGGDPHWARAWSIQNILNKGGLDPLKAL